MTGATPLVSISLATLRRRRSALLGILAIALLAGCSKMEKMLPNERLEYKHATEAGENLELPPDLASAGFDDALDIPPASGSTTLSEYAGERSARTRIAQSGDVLPGVGGVELRRSGDRRWLEIDAPPKAVWPRVVSFWRSQGIVLLEQDPAVGVMRTDWLENRAEIRTDFVTRQLRKVVDGLYSTSTRDQYRLRMDTGPRPGTTDVFMTHTGMVERLVRNTAGEGSNTVWEPGPSDPDKEAAMLRRLMLYLGVTDRDAERMLLSGGSAAPAGGSAPTPRVAGAGTRLERGPGGGVIMIPEEFQTGWRLTGLALDSAGFAVEDRDREAGVFYVRYANLADGPAPKRNLGSRLKFWRKDDKEGVEQYQVRVVAQGDRTEVTVHDMKGQRDTSPSAERILTLLQEQMR